MTPRLRELEAKVNHLDRERDSIALRYKTLGKVDGYKMALEDRDGEVADLQGKLTEALMDVYTLQEQMECLRYSQSQDSFDKEHQRLMDTLEERDTALAQVKALVEAVQAATGFGWASFQIVVLESLAAATKENHK